MKGVSPLVSMVLVIAFGFTAMAIVLTVVNPLLNRAKDAGMVNDAIQNMQLLDSAIKTVAIEPKASKRTLQLKITEGVLRSDPTKEWVYIEYDPRTNYKLDGVSGDVQIVSRPQFVEFFNQFSDGSITATGWINVNGTWTVDSNRLKGIGGIAYHNVGNQSGFEFDGKITVNTEPRGQIFVIPGEPKDLVLFLPLDEGTGTTAYDYSAYFNNGTLMNSSSWTVGKFGNATMINGATDYVGVAHSGSLNITDKITLEVWVNIP